MFGHDNHHQQDNDQPSPDGALSHDAPTLPQPQLDDLASDYIEDDGPVSSTPTVTQPDPQATDNNNPAPATPVVQTPAVDAPSTDNGATPAPTSDVNTDKLLDIKQQALQQLTPLVGHLEQTPEEKFRTTMMMIQAADNHELIQAAYDAAQQISDEKVRAQALLDIVNEINYFTHSNSQES